MHAALQGVLTFLLFLCTVAGSPVFFEVILTSNANTRHVHRGDVCGGLLQVRVPSLYREIEVVTSLSNAWHVLLVANSSQQVVKAGTGRVQLRDSLLPAGSEAEAEIKAFFSLDPSQTCSENCPGGFRRVGHAKPYSCVRCAPDTLTREQACALNYVSASSPICNKDVQVFDDMWFLDCARRSATYTDSLTACSEPGNGHRWYLAWQDVFPKDRASCQRAQVCKQGFYQEPRTASRCIACSDSGDIGMRGVARSVGGPLQGISLEDSCECDRGQFFDRNNRVCRLCGPNSFGGERGLHEECDECLSCHSKRVFGSRECLQDCGSGVPMYWSQSAGKCKTCPNDMLAMSQSVDFAHAGLLNSGDFFLNTSLCAASEYSSQCRPPPPFWQRKKTCAAGHEVVPGSDTQDAQCKPCSNQTYSSDGKVCSPRTACFGLSFSSAAVVDPALDTVCSEEPLQATWSGDSWDYPVTQDHGQVYFSDPRSFSILSVPTAACIWRPGTDDRSLFTNALFDAWQRGDLLLPFPSPPDCIFSCRPGSYRTGGNTPTCTACPPGQYSTTADAEQCLPCPPGFFAPAVGSTACLPCAENHYNSQHGASECLPCCQLGHDTCTYSEHGELKTSSASGSYLASTCAPGSTRHNLRPCSDVMQECPGCVYGTGLTWEEYGPGHCLMPEQCSPVAHAVGWETKSECKPFCETSRYAALKNGSWACIKCDSDASRCPAGHFVAESCSANRNSACLSCDAYLTPFSRVSSVATNVSGKASCLTACRGPNLAAGTWFLTLAEVAEIIGASPEDTAQALQSVVQGERTLGLCIPSTVATDICPGSEDSVMIPVLTVDTNNSVLKDDSFSPHDASYASWPRVSCQSAVSMQDFKVGQLFKQVLPGSQGGQRRLLDAAAAVETFCEEGMFLLQTGKCAPCAFGTMSFRGARSEADCFCMPGFFRESSSSSLACRPCPVQAPVYCPGGFDENSLPSNVRAADRGVGLFSCHPQTSARPNATQCACPGNSSNEFSFARSIVDCIPDAGFKLDRDRLKNGEFILELCAEFEEQRRLTRYVKSATRGQVLVDECAKECDVRSGARPAGASEMCECDADRNLTWRGHTQSCECADGFFYAPGAELACLPCLQNHYCVANRQVACPPGMVSAPLSQNISDCICEVGMFIVSSDAEGTRCEVCKQGGYCADGISLESCQIGNIGDGTEMFCEITGLSFPQRCPGGHIRSFGQCLVADAFQLQLTHGNLPRLFLNLPRLDGDRAVNFSPLVDATLIPGILAIEWLAAAASFKAVPEVGMIAAPYDIFCAKEPGVETSRSIIASAASKQTNFAEGSLVCVSEHTLQRRLMYTANARPRTFNVGTDSFMDESVARRYVQNSPVLDASLNLALNKWHLAWGVALDCDSTGAHTRWHSSEIQICSRECPASQKRLSHKTSIETTLRTDTRKLSHTELVWMDVPSQLGWLSTFSPPPPPGSSVFMVLRQNGVGGSSTDSIQIEVATDSRSGIYNMPVVALSGREVGRVAFAISMPRWRYASPFAPSILMGTCSQSGEFRLVLFRVLSGKVFEVRFDCTSLLCFRVPQICHSEDGSGSFSAAVEGDYLYFLNKARPADGIFFVPLRKLNPTRLVSTTQNYIESSLAIDPDSFMQGSERILDVAWYASCVSVDSESRRYCPIDFFVLRQDTFFHVAPQVQRHPATESSVAAIGDLYTPRPIFTKEKLCKLVRELDACRYSMRRFAMLSTAQTEEYQNVYGAPADVFFDFIVALEPPLEEYLLEDNRAHPVFLFHVHFNSTFEEFSVLPPIFLRQPILFMQYAPHLSPTPETGFENVLAARGAVVVAVESLQNNGQLTLDVFGIACAGCIDDNTVVEPSTGTCKCLPGTVPVATPCFDHCSSTRFSLNATETRRSAVVPEYARIPNGFVHSCVPCSGFVYCVDGTVDGVFSCPAHKYSLSAFSQKEEDCTCDMGQKGAVLVQPEEAAENLPAYFPNVLRFLDTPGDSCTPCSDNMVCNVFTNSQQRITQCGGGSSLTVSSNSDVYRCVCANGTYAMSSHMSHDSHQHAPVLAENEWPPESPLAAFSGRSQKTVNTELVTCAACPASFFCANNRIEPCPRGSTSGENSSSVRDCTCGAGFVLDTTLDVCTECAVSYDYICVDGKNLSCTGDASRPSQCPCPPVDGKAMITVPGSGTCATKCPANHFCPPFQNAGELHALHVPLPCPGNMVSPAGSRSLDQCICPSGFYLDESDSVACRLCPAMHYCVGSAKIACPPGFFSEQGQSSQSDCHCIEDDLCGCDEGMQSAGAHTCLLHSEHPAKAWRDDGTAAECASGFAPRQAAAKIFADARQISSRQDDPLSPDFRIAMQQFARYFKDTEGADCVLCPPGAVCLGGDRIRLALSSPGTQFGAMLMGSFAQGAAEFKCPGANTKINQLHRLTPLGLSSCFSNAFLWSSTEDQVFSAIMAAKPTGLVLLDSNSANFDSKLWSALSLNEPSAWSRKLFADPDWPSVTSVVEAQIGMALIRIDAPAVVLGILRNIATKRRRLLMLQELLEIDQGSGIAAEILLQTAWAILLADSQHSQGLNAEGVVLLEGIVKTAISSGIASRAVSTIVRFFQHRYSSLQHVRAPRVVFATHFREIKSLDIYSAALYKHNNMHFVFSGLCSVAIKDSACQSPFTNGVLMASYPLDLSLSKHVVFNYEVFNSETALHSLIKLDKRMELARQRKCPFSTVPSETEGMIKCSPCAQDNYNRQFFSVSSQSCADCSVVHSSDCSIMNASSNAHACSFASDAHCA